MKSRGTRLYHLLGVCASACLLLAISGGCGSSGAKTYPVQGRVEFPNGKPLAGGSVEFRAILEGGDTYVASGIIQSDGTFTLTTFKPNDGAVAGAHQVAVFPSKSLAAASSRPMPQTLSIDARFKNYDTSGLSAVVEARAANQVTLRVEAPRAPGSR